MRADEALSALSSGSRVADRAPQLGGFHASVAARSAVLAVAEPVELAPELDSALVPQSLQNKKLGPQKSGRPALDKIVWAISSSHPIAPKSATPYI